MPRNAAPLTLGSPAASLLRDALDAIARTSAHAHGRRAARVALTVRPCLPARDVPPGRPIPACAWRLLALTHRWRRQSHAGARRCILLAVYKPVIDLPGTGCIRLGCERVLDLAARRVVDPERRPADARAAVLLHQALVDADARDLVDAFDLPAAYFLYHPDRPPALEDTFPADAWEAARVEVDGLVGYPAWMLARPAAVPMARTPERVVAFLRRGRGVRNPAFAALQRHGLIDPGSGYRAWLDTVARPAPEGLVVRDSGNPASPAGRLRRALADHAPVNPAGRGRPPRLESLLGDLRHGCEAAGVPIPDDPGAARDALLALLDRPWVPAHDPDAAPIQVVDLGERGGSAAMRFENGAAEVDLDDLGDAADRYPPATPGAIRAALGGSRGGRRGGSRPLAERRC